MSKQKSQNFEDLPAEIPLFPLGGVLLLPGGQLPLNIFEPRYIAMVEHALKTDRMIGMVQPKDSESKDENPPLFETGCAGRITLFEETDDGRYLITLNGICRFKITEEKPLDGSGFRKAGMNWSDYKDDLEQMSCLDLDREKMKTLLSLIFLVICTAIPENFDFL